MKPNGYTSDQSGYCQSGILCSSLLKYEVYQLFKSVIENPSLEKSKQTVYFVAQPFTTYKTGK